MEDAGGPALDAFAAGQQLFTEVPAKEGPARVLTARSLRTGKAMWTVAAGASTAAFTPTRMFLLDSGPHGRSLLIDRRTGAATPVLADCLSCVGKMGIDNTAAIAGDSLVITGSAGNFQTVVGYPLS